MRVNAKAFSRGWDIALAGDPCPADPCKDLEAGHAYGLILLRKDPEAASAYTALPQREKDADLNPARRWRRASIEDYAAR